MSVHKHRFDREVGEFKLEDAFAKLEVDKKMDNYLGSKELSAGMTSVMFDVMMMKSFKSLVVQVKDDLYRYDVSKYGTGCFRFRLTFINTLTTNQTAYLFGE